MNIKKTNKTKNNDIEKCGLFYKKWKIYVNNPKYNFSFFNNKIVKAQKNLLKKIVINIFIYFIKIF